VVGIVLLIVGAALLFEPVVPQANETISSKSSLPYVAESVSGYSLTGSIVVHVSWTAPSTVTVLAGACTASCNGASDVSSLTTQSGTSGSFTLNQPNGGEFLIGAINGTFTSGSAGSPANATFTISTALATVGTLLIVVGIIVFIAGVVLRSDKARAAAMAAKQSPAMPATDPAAPPAGPTPPSS